MQHLKLIAIALLSIVLSACQIAPIQPLSSGISLDENSVAKGFNTCLLYTSDAADE